MALNPAPGRRRVLTFVSPKVDDLVFFELRNSTLPEYRTAPAYGTAHPDDSQFPHHVLVYVTPALDNDPGWQRWYYAAKRDNQDDYNFEIDVDGNLTRTYIIPRSEYLDGTSFPEPAVGTADDTFTSCAYAGQTVKRIGQQQLDSYFVVIQRSYPKNPGEEVSISEAGSPRGETSTVTKTGYAPDAEGVTGGIVLQRTSRQGGDGSWQNSEEQLALWSGESQRSEELRPGVKRVRTDQITGVQPSADANVQGFSRRMVTTDVDGNPRIWEKGQTTNENNPTTGKEVSRELGGGIATTSYSTVDEGTDPDTGILVLDSKVDPFGDGKALKTTKTLPEYPNLVEDVFDPDTDSIIRVTKSVIAPGSESGSYSAGNVTEIRPVDKWRSIKINSQFVSSPDGNIDYHPFTMSWRYPAVLTGITLRFVAAWATGGGKFDYAEDMAVELDIKESFSAVVQGRIKRTITSDPSSLGIAGSSVIYKPESHTVAYAAAWWYATTDGSRVQAQANIQTFQTPLALCSGITITMEERPSTDGEVTVDGELTPSIPATAAPPTGWTTVEVSQPRRLKLGLWEVRETQVNLENPLSL